MFYLPEILAAMPGPYRSAVAITPDDETVIPATKAIYNGGSAADKTITVKMANGEDNVALKNFPLGFNKISVIKVYSTGTSGSDYTALY